MIFNEWIDVGSYRLTWVVTVVYRSFFSSLHRTRLGRAVARNFSSPSSVCRHTMTCPTTCSSSFSAKTWPTPLETGSLVLDQAANCHGSRSPSVGKQPRAKGCSDCCSALWLCMWCAIRIKCLLLRLVLSGHGQGLYDEEVFKLKAANPTPAAQHTIKNVFVDGGTRQRKLVLTMWRYDLQYYICWLLVASWWQRDLNNTVHSGMKSLKHQEDKCLLSLTDHRSGHNHLLHLFNSMISI